MNRSELTVLEECLTKNESTSLNVIVVTKAMRELARERAIGAMRWAGENGWMYYGMPNDLWGKPDGDFIDSNQLYSKYEEHLKK